MPFPVPGKVAEMLRRSTVQIRKRSQRQEGNGSGIALADGRVLTNFHVISGGGDLTVENWEGASAQARLERKDPRNDLALLAVDRLSAPSAVFSSNVPHSGQPVIAVGNPLGFVGAMSTGAVYRVSAVRGLGSTRWIQSDVRLAPGNSGGPLADIHGDLVGINTMIAGPFALAIALDRVQTFLSAKDEPAALGVTVRPVRLGRQNRVGFIVLEVDESSPAAGASLFPGDILVGAGDKEITSPDDLHQAISQQGTLLLDFLRGNSQRVRRVAVLLVPAQTVHAA